MRIVMFSNYLNHHQYPLAEAFNSFQNVEYIFVATTPFNDKRSAMGYKDENSKYDFVIRAYESKEKELQAHGLAREADLAIVGSAPDLYMAERLESGRVTFHSSERYFKKGLGIKTFPRYFSSAMKHIRPYQSKPLYYLCSSAYTAGDVNTFANYRNRCYKWAYFTEVRKFDDNELIERRKKNSLPTILWAGRFLDWKHPDVTLRLANRLKKQGYHFQMNIIGGGELERQLKSTVQERHLDDSVSFLGFLPPDAVRTHMENADIFLFTSDFHEGWGAVLNEAMSSGCAVVSSHAPGAAPFLIDDGNNGFLYENGNEEHLYLRVLELLNNPDKRIQMGLDAYKNMIETWNPKQAASRLIALNEAIKEGNSQTLFESGPCSPAGILGNGWYKA